MSSNESKWRQRLVDADSRIDELMSQMTVEEKVSLCHAGGKFTNNGIERLGIPKILMSDGPHGVRQELNQHSWEPLDVDYDHATYLPPGTALAATWNPELAAEHGRVLGSESRARGKDIILGPGFNIIRHPLCGRNFEYYSEDPYLITQLAPRVVQAVQDEDTAACIKHLALNSQELNRFHTDTDPDDRTLREIYLPGFEACVKEGLALTLMGAYNKYRGQWCCHNHRLLVEILKEEWGFEGLVVSDWNGTHDTMEAVMNGLDIEMGTSKEDYKDYYLADAFLELIKSGKVDADILDDKVRRILRVIIAIGMLDPDTRKEGARCTPEHAQAARKIGEQAPALLKNDDVLPLNADKIKKLAVIGENAIYPQSQGGGSSGVKSVYEVLPLDGIKNMVGDQVEVVFAKGYPETDMPYPQLPTEFLGTADQGSGVKGWRLEWHNSHGFDEDPIAVQAKEQVAQKLEKRETVVPDQKTAWWAQIWRTELIVPESGTYTFALQTDASADFYLDDEQLIHFSSNYDSSIYTAEVQLERGREYRLMIKYWHFDGPSSVQFGCLRPGQTLDDSGGLREEALTVAREADAVVFFAGLNHFYDAEGPDRKGLELPGGQDALISELAKVNSNMTVVMVSGSPIAMPWIDDVPAVLQGWYAGLEAGNIFADILFGKVNPSGKLPFTFPKTMSDTAPVMLDDYHEDICHYKEGVMVGYRWYDHKGIEPLFPFGHGLSYTTFAYSDLVIADGEGDTVAKVSCTLTNTGGVAGYETAQLYIQDVEASVERPVRELKGFRKVNLEPGQSETVTFDLDFRSLAFWDVKTDDWCAEPGIFKVFVGSSSRDLRLEGELEYPNADHQ